MPVIRRKNPLAGLSQLPDINQGMSDEDLLTANPLNILKILQGLNNPEYSPLAGIPESDPNEDPGSTKFSLSPAADRSYANLPRLPPGSGDPMQRGIAAAGRSLGNDFLGLMKGATTPGALTGLGEIPDAYNAIRDAPNSPYSSALALGALALPGIGAVRVNPAYKGIPDASWLHEGRSPRTVRGNNTWGLQGQLGEASYWTPEARVGEGFLRGDDLSGVAVADVTMENPLDINRHAPSDFRREVLKHAKNSYRMSNPVQYSQVKRMAVNPNMRVGHIIRGAGLGWTKDLTDIARNLNYDAITDLEGWSGHPSAIPDVSDYPQMALLNPRHQVSVRDFLMEDDYRALPRSGIPTGQVTQVPGGQYARSVLERVEELKRQGKPFEDALAQARAEGHQPSLSTRAVQQRANTRLGQQNPAPIDLLSYRMYDAEQTKADKIKLTQEIMTKYGTSFKEAAAMAKGMLDEEAKRRLNQGLRTPIF